MLEPKKQTAEEMRERLRRAFAEDPERSLLTQLKMKFLDPLKPEDEGGRQRIYSLWLILGVGAAGVLALFIYMGLFQ